MTVNEMFLMCIPERTASIAARRTAGALMLSVSLTNEFRQDVEKRGGCERNRSQG